MDIAGPLGEKHISETLNEKLVFEVAKDNWPEHTYRAAKKLFDKVQLPVGKGSKISVIVDVTVKSPEKEERKKIEIEYYYRKSKYPEMPT